MYGVGCVVVFDSVSRAGLPRLESPDSVGHTLRGSLREVGDETEDNGRKLTLNCMGMLPITALLKSFNWSYIYHFK